MERIAEVAVVLIVGAMLAFISVPDAAYWFVPVLLMIRPVCVWVCIAGSTTTRQQRVLMAWFGIRGIGSVYYLMYAINHGLDAGLAEPFIAGDPCWLSSGSFGVVVFIISSSAMVAVAVWRRVWPVGGH